MNAEKILSITIEAIGLAILTGMVYWVAMRCVSGKRVLSSVFVVLEIIALGSLTIGAYFGAWLLVGILVHIDGHLPFVTFAISTAIVDVVYICTIKFWPLRNIHIKIIVGLLLFAFSAAIATCYLVAYMFVMPS
jgi:hypothetical protein